MKILGIDYGTKRIGVALSDDEAGLAFPHEVFKNTPGVLEHIKVICEKHGVEDIVIGKSLTTAGEHNPVMKDIARFVEELKRALDIRVHLIDESFTSVEADRLDKTDVRKDARAAALILQRYLDTSHG